MTLLEFNLLPKNKAKEYLFACCGSSNWAEQLADKLPFDSIPKLKMQSDEIWSGASREDIMEAFSHHPKIGDLKSLEKKFAATSHWASGEQSSVNAASEEVLKRLAQGNNDYENKFGFIFIVCATGKSAQEMLDLLEKRLPNSMDKELKIAAEEQNKITHIRIDKLFV